MLTCSGTSSAPSVSPSREGPESAPQRLGGAAEANAPRQILLSAPTISCGQCIAAVEDTLNACAGVTRARVNLTLRRVSATSTGPEATPERLIAALEARGYPATLIEPMASIEEAEARTTTSLLRAVAIAGFGAANIMLLSVAVWAGADGAMRDIFHLLSAMIALPVAAYAGRPFFGSAFAALKARRLNMDVPITLGVLLALALSLFELAQGGEEVFFDAAVTLLFFLLIGRYLDRLMRDRARSAVSDLARIGAKSAVLLNADGTTESIALEMIEAGQTLRVAAGERMPVDALILSGQTDLDRSIVTGESAPVPAGPGLEVEAGALNLTGPLDIRALRPAKESFLAQMLLMLQAAEAGRGRYVRIADRAARLYAPVVHLLAAATFIGWMLATDGDWRVSIFTAISVLIITCPCALGLAVPVVHVIAAGRLFRQGVMMKDGAALERLAEIDHVVFDKTGTLTTGAPRVTSPGPRRPMDRAAARALALHSQHPASKAIAAWLDTPPAEATEIAEIPGRGMEALFDGRRARLGRADWVAEIAMGPSPDASGPAFAFAGGRITGFALSETLRDGAVETIAALQAEGLEVEMLSGDGAEPVARMAAALGLSHARSGCSPAEKTARLDQLRAEGRHPLMVGDGLNDVAALASAHVSMAPGSASEIGRNAADFVFTRGRLDAVLTAHRIAQRAARLVRSNFGLAIAYNCVAIPLAVAGLVTPLIAALAMSGSSIIVVANSLRLNRAPAARKPRAAGAKLSKAAA